tara:strand:+ start:2461 stop:3576 length:1116 start_codon:yes stop_codon:yes gene_type:complete
MSTILHPRKTKALIGHNEQIKTFIDTFENNKLHHSWLLEGPAGLGKATFAYCMSKSILSIKKNKNETFLLDDNDNNDELNLKYEEKNLVHNRVKENTHVDLKVIERDNAEIKPYSTEIIPVNKVRELQYFFSKTAGEGGKRIAIIDCLDNLNLYGCNALLKILEEPPNNCLIFLISNNKSNVLDTIRSRCRVLKFKNLSTKDSNKIIENNIGKNIDKDMLNKLNILSNGTPGKGILFYENNGIEIYDYLIEIFKSLPEINIEHSNKLYTLITSQNNIFELNTLKELITIFYSRTYRKYLNLLKLSISEEENIAQNNLLKNFNIVDISSLWENIYNELNQASELNLEKKQVVVNMIEKLRNFKPYNINYKKI